ncbi:hypothetical protein BJX99DRAFT_232200 [Aspergillus californicus]
MMGFLHKACDRCRAKKIRCASPNESRCEYCQVSLRRRGLLSSDDLDVTVYC